MHAVVLRSLTSHPYKVWQEQGGGGLQSAEEVTVQNDTQAWSILVLVL